MIGERCPYPDPHARGGFIGLGLNHTRADLVRAVMEGVVFNLARHLRINYSNASFRR